MRRSFNPAKLNYFLNHKDIFPSIAPDGVSHIDGTDMIERPDTYFFIGDGIGLIFWRVSDNIYESDIYALSRSRGAKALQAAKEGLSFMFGFADEIRAKVPSFNRQSRYFVRNLGFEVTGIEPECWPKNGIKHDVITYRIVKWDQS